MGFVYLTYWFFWILIVEFNTKILFVFLFNYFRLLGFFGILNLLFIVFVVFLVLCYSEMIFSIFIRVIVFDGDTVEVGVSRVVIRLLINIFWVWWICWWKSYLIGWVIFLYFFHEDIICSIVNVNGSEVIVFWRIFLFI